MMMTKIENLNMIWNADSFNSQNWSGFMSNNYLNQNANGEDSIQLVKFSGCVGADYWEAKESEYWSRLINETNKSRKHNETEILFQEAVELKKYFLQSSEKSN